MNDKPWEGRSVWCASSGDTPNGWVEVQEADALGVRLITRRGGGYNDVAVQMTREQAKTLAAHIMNLAGRARQ